MTLAAVAAGTTEPATPFGFGAADGSRELALEQRFDAALDPADLRAWLQTLSAEPNHVGAPHDKANAEYVRALFQHWGWDARIEVFEVLYPTLKQHSLELVAPTHFTASLTEPLATVVDLVNLHPDEDRAVIVQAGAFAEHTIETVRYTGCADGSWLGSLYDYGHGEPTVTEHHLDVHGPWLTVQLPASTRIRLRLTLAIRTRAPSYATPFDGAPGTGTP